MQIIRKKIQLGFSIVQKEIKQIELFCIHAQAKTCSVEDIHQWHLKKGWSGIGYHFLVRKDGTIYQGRPEDTIGAHAKGANHDSIGICAEGDFMKEEMNPLQLNALIDLVSYIKNKYHLSSIKRHKDVASTDCPGTHFPFSTIISSNHIVLEDTWLQRLNQEIKKQGFRTYPTVKRDAQVKITRLIQERLNFVGFNLKIDGIFGINTEKAVKKFQNNRNLKVDGIVGKKTWSYLIKGIKVLKKLL